MPKIIKNQTVVEDEWTLILSDDWDDSLLGRGLKMIIPVSIWLKHHQQTDRICGVWLNSDEHPEVLNGYIERLPLIAINFPDFNDGRGYSYARILREQFGFDGELRAIGDVLQDQLHYLHRCGFDAFSVRQDKDPYQAIAGLSDFSHSYQSAYNTRGQPLVLR